MSTRCSLVKGASRRGLGGLAYGAALGARRGGGEQEGGRGWVLCRVDQLKLMAADESSSRATMARTFWAGGQNPVCVMKTNGVAVAAHGGSHHILLACHQERSEARKQGSKVSSTCLQKRATSRLQPWALQVSQK